MLLKSILFGRENPKWFYNDDRTNLINLRMMEGHINAIIHKRGYIYLNQICEFLGEKWDMDWKNTCVKNSDEHRLKYIEFEVLPQPFNEYLVNILTYD